MNSPWAIMATCINWILVRPTISSSFLSVSLGGYSVPSGIRKETDSLSSFIPFPRFNGRICLGTRRTLYS